MIACHADHIGSLLRPSELIAAREEAAAGRISRARFKAIEDGAVEDAIGLQESVGLRVITDGEQRRLSFADSTGRRNTLAKSFCWSFVV